MGRKEFISLYGSIVKEVEAGNRKLELKQKPMEECSFLAGSP